MNTRIDLKVPTPYPVFDWIEQNVKSALVRKVADFNPYLNTWHLKIVLDGHEAVEAFKLAFQDNIVDN
jgi:hypothetical protein